MSIKASHKRNIINPLTNKLPNILISLNANSGEYIQNNTQNTTSSNTASPIQNGLDIKNFPIFLKKPAIAPINTPFLFIYMLLFFYICIFFY